MRSLVSRQIKPMRFQDAQTRLTHKAFGKLAWRFGEVSVVRCVVNRTHRRPHQIRLDASQALDHADESEIVVLS